MVPPTEEECDQNGDIWIELCNGNPTELPFAVLAECVEENPILLPCPGSELTSDGLGW